MQGNDKDVLFANDVVPLLSNDCFNIYSANLAPTEQKEKSESEPMQRKGKRKALRERRTVRRSDTKRDFVISKRREKNK